MMFDVRNVKTWRDPPLVLSILSNWLKCCGGWVEATSLMKDTWSAISDHKINSQTLQNSNINKHFLKRSKPNSASSYRAWQRNKSSAAELCRAEEAQWAERWRESLRTPIRRKLSFLWVSVALWFVSCLSFIWASKFSAALDWATKILNRLPSPGRKASGPEVLSWASAKGTELCKWGVFKYRTHS